MTNYKKSLLSLAAVIALGTGANAANTYLPLASDTVDYEWTMFGVDGFISSDGSSASTTFTTGWVTLSDASTDDISTSGIQAATGTGGPGNLIELKALPNATDKIATVQINVDTTDTIFVDTEPMRSMYVKLGNDTEANVYITYKASLEATTIEVQRSDTASTKTYEVVLSAVSTYSNAATATIKSAVSNATQITAVKDLLDWDFSNNPKDPADYSDTYRDTDAASVVRMYEYDAPNTNWLIYDTGNEGVTGGNDFSDLSRGKAYWARADMDGTGNTAHAGKPYSSGMTLASQEVVDADYAGKLNAGWNMISFNSANPTIRTSSTGLIIACDLAAGATTFKIIDSTGTNTVTVDSSGATTQALALAINLAVENAKARGDLPDTFDLRAFRSSAVNIVLISNKRFSVIDTGDANFDSAVTLANQNVWDVTNNVLADVSALNAFDGAGVTTSISSVYGEYAMAIEPLIGTQAAGLVASAVDAAPADGVHPASILVDSDTATLVVMDGATANSTVADTVTSLTTALETQTTAGAAGGDALATAIDFDLNGVEDYIIAASTQKFYVRDHTFTRVFTTQNDAVVADAISTTGTLATGLVAAGATTAATVVNLNAVQATTGVFVRQPGGAGTEFVAFSASLDTQNFNLSDNLTNDFLIDATNADDIAKGAVKNVWTIDKLAKEPVATHNFKVQLTKLEIEKADDTALGEDTIINGTTVLIASPASVATDLLKASFLDTIIDGINAQSVTQGLDIVASHDFNSSAAAYPVNILVEGYGVTSVTVDIDTTGVATNAAGVEQHDGIIVATKTAGTIINTNGSLTDLKYNAFHTPDFAKDGPLYTLKDINYTAKSFITGTSDFTAAASGITWDSLDLTKDVNTWFDDRDYNLFSIDGKAGYWVYLVDDTTTSGVAITKNTISPTYTHHFNNTLKTVTNNISTSLNVFVTGLSTTTPITSTVYASINGVNVDLTGDPTVSTEWTATISSYEISGLQDSTNDITVSASTGLGKSTLTVDINATIDLIAPQKPVVNAGAGGSDFSIEANATDSDVAGFYVFDTFVPDKDVYDANVSSTSQYVGILPAIGGSLDFCASDVITFGTSITLLAMAVDGDGTFGNGNVSDMTEFEFAPFLKSSNILYHIGTTTVASLISTAYGTDCTQTGVVEADDNGISLRSVTSNIVSYLAYSKIDGVTFAFGTPYTIYLKNAAGSVVEIKFAPNYAGKAFYVEIDGKVYSATLPADDTTYGSIGSAGDIETNVILGRTIVASQTFPVL